MKAVLCKAYGPPETLVLEDTNPPQADSHQVVIVGVFWDTFATHEPELNRAYLQEMFSLVKAGKLRPLIPTTYPLSQAADALNEMLQRKVKGKVVLQIDEI